MKRILIFHISEVSGHRRAAEAIREALEYIAPHAVDVCNVDALKYFHPYAHNVINHAYIGVIRATPFIWKAMYDKATVARVLNPLKNAIHRNKMKAMSRIFKEFRPDVIVCTQAFPCGIAADFKKEFGIRVPVVGVVTDFHPHRYWAYNEVDFYTVATDEAKDTLSALGIPSERIKVFGIPISPHFVRFNMDKTLIGRKWGLAHNVPTVLIMGGGSGLGPIERIVTELDQISGDFQIIVVCGKNRKLFLALETLRSTFKKKIVLFQYVEFINELMSFSDILITKPGGITVAEALTLDLALVVIKPIPGQEENNTEVLLKENVAVQAERVEDVSMFVKRCIEDRTYLNEFKHRGARLSKPDASIKIAELVLHADKSTLL